MLVIKKNKKLDFCSCKRVSDSIFADFSEAGVDSFFGAGKPCFSRFFIAILPE
jgi:hypothetical protein